MHYVGVDLHKQTSWFYIVDENGKKVSSKNIANKSDELKKYFTQIPKPFTLAVEATYNWYFFIDMAEEYAEEVYLANSFELKAFAKQHKKTDKIDARLIANILWKGFLPVVYIADTATRQLRELLRCRTSAVQDRCRTIFRLKALLDKLGLDSTGDFTTYKRLEEASTCHTTPTYTVTIHNYIKRVRFFIEKEIELESTMKTIATSDSDIIHLMTVPGLSYFSASLIKSEIVTIERFKSFNRLCAYAGLAPKVHASGNKIVHGSLNRNRRKHLQWIILETVFHYIRMQPEKKQFFEQLQKSKSYNVAKIVLARDMLKVVYHILKEERPFYYKSTKIQSVETIAL